MAVNERIEVASLDVLSREKVGPLVEPGEWPRVSIFMPTHRAGRDTEQGAIRLKNLRKEARGRLVEQGMRGAEAEGLLKPVDELEADHAFWQHQDYGLAVYLSREGARCYRVPRPLEAYVSVGDRYAVKPLLPLAGEDGAFYLFALSENEVRLFRGTAHELERVESDVLPANFADAMQIDEDPSTRLQFHTETAQQPAISGDRSAVFHGQGGSDDDAEHKRWLLDYCHILDRAVDAIVRDKKAPLLLACVEELFVIYKQANTHGNLLDRHIPGNTEHLTPKKLHEQAWDIVRPVFQRGRDRAVERYQEQAGTQGASDDIQEILTAAHDGRVESLLIAPEEAVWGTFDATRRLTTVHESAEEGDEDLLDLAVALTYRNGGTAYGLERDAMPSRTPLAAVFRY